jgi:hypothetical protein
MSQNDKSDIKWHAGSVRKCVKCGVLFYGVIKNTEADAYCQRPCMPDDFMESTHDEPA